MDTSRVHQVWTKHRARHGEGGEEDKTDRGRGGETTSGNGQAWSSPSPRGQWRIEKNEGNLWCTKRPSRLGDRRRVKEGFGDLRFALIMTLCDRLSVSCQESINQSVDFPWEREQSQRSATHTLPHARTASVVQNVHYV